MEGHAGFVLVPDRHRSHFPVGLLALIPLVLLLLNRPVLFMLSYALRWRSGRPNDPPRTIDAR